MTLKQRIKKINLKPRLGKRCLSVFGCSNLRSRIAAIEFFKNHNFSWMSYKAAPYMVTVNTSICTDYVSTSYSSNTDLCCRTR